LSNQSKGFPNDFLPNNRFCATTVCASFMPFDANHHGTSTQIGHE
jgi:hypothetical protein